MRAFTVGKSYFISNDDNYDSGNDISYDSNESSAVVAEKLSGDRSANQLIFSLSFLTLINNSR